MEDERPENVLARNWSILGGLRNALKDKSLSAEKRKELLDLEARTAATIKELQSKAPLTNADTRTIALNGAAFGVAIAALRICWSWTAWTGYRLSPFEADTQLLYAYMVFWYAAAGAVIFVVARNVLNSIAWR
jgi:hypothetical protein